MNRFGSDRSTVGGGLAKGWSFAAFSSCSILGGKGDSQAKSTRIDIVFVVSSIVQTCMLSVHWRSVTNCVHVLSHPLFQKVSCRFNLEFVLSWGGALGNGKPSATKLCEWDNTRPDHPCRFVHHDSPSLLFGKRVYRRKTVRSVTCQSVQNRDNLHLSNDLHPFKFISH